MNSVLMDKDLNILNPKIPRYEKLKMETLWTNSSPENGMPNNYAIHLSSDNYDELVFIYCYNNVSTNMNIEMASMCRKGKDILLTGIGYALGSTVRRRLNYQDDLTYIASIGISGSSNENTDSVCIPVKIIGIKH